MLPIFSGASQPTSVWSYGHRNPQGMHYDAVEDRLYATEHGPLGGDEFNLVIEGRNYGWPVIGYGVNYRSGTAIHSGTHADGMEPPSHIWVPSIGISGMHFYGGRAFPSWRGDLFVGGLRGERLVRLRLDGSTVLQEETIVHSIGRIRDVREGPDGYLYLALDGGTRWEDGPPTAIVRLEPAGRR